MINLVNSKTVDQGNFIQSVFTRDSMIPAWSRSGIGMGSYLCNSLAVSVRISSKIRSASNSPFDIA